MSAILLRNRSASYHGARHRLWPLAALLPFLLLAACTSPEEREAQHLERALALYEQGEDAKAMVELNNVLRLNPKNADAIYQTGLIHQRAGRLEPAYGAFHQATVERPEFVAAQVSLGAVALALGDEETAGKAAEVIVAAEPDNVDGLVLKGRLALRGGDKRHALQYALAALEKVPEHETAVIVLAGVHYELGEHKQALERIEQALLAHPESIDLRLMKIRVLQEVGDVQRLDTTYREIVALRPDNVTYRLALHGFYRQREDFAQAEAVLREAIDDGLVVGEIADALVDLVYQQGGFEAAEADLKKMIEREPTNYDLRFRLADLYVSQARSDDAEGVLSGILDSTENVETTNDARAALARVRFAEGDTESASQLVEETLAASADHPLANLLQGVMLLRAGDSERATRYAQAALRRNPTWLPGLRLLAQVRIETGEMDLAVDALWSVLHSAPKDVSSAETLAYILTQRGDLETAVKLWDHVVRIAPEPERGLQARAAIAIHQQNWSEADENIRWLLEIPDQELTASLLQGQLLLARGELEAARAAFAEAQRVAPDAAEPLRGVVESYISADDIKGALAYLEQHLSENPDDRLTLMYMSVILASQGENDAAREGFDRAARIEPLRPAAYRQMGQLLYRAGDLEGTIQTFRSGLEQHPEDTGLLDGLAQVYFAAGQLDEAINIYERLLSNGEPTDVAVNNYAALVADFGYDDSEALDRALAAASSFRGSDNPDFLDTLGWLHFRRGEFAEARSYLERAVSLAPNQPQFRYHLGLVLYRTDQPDRAMDELERAVMEGARYQGIEEARSVLAELRAARADRG